MVAGACCVDVNPDAVEGMFHTDEGFRAANPKSYDNVRYDPLLCPDFGMRGGSGRGKLPSSHPLSNATISNNTGVKVLDPRDLVLGQVVVFGQEVIVGKNTSGIDGSLMLTYFHQIRQGNLGHFGFNESLGVFCVYVDLDEPGTVGGASARASIGPAARNRYSWGLGPAIVHRPIVFGISVDGLQEGDRVYVKWWVEFKVADGSLGSDVSSQFYAAEFLPTDINRYNLTSVRMKKQFVHVNTTDESGALFMMMRTAQPWKRPPPEVQQQAKGSAGGVPL